MACAHGSRQVDYSIELDKTAAAAAKTASATMTVPDVTIPASANGGVELIVRARPRALQSTTQPLRILSLEF